LHFATEHLDAVGADGAVWCVDYSVTNNDLPARLKRVLAVEGSDVFTAELLERAVPTVGKYDALAPERFVAFLDPRRSTSAGSISSPSSRRCRAPRPVRRMARGGSGVWRKLVIPAAREWKSATSSTRKPTERVLDARLDGSNRRLRRSCTCRRPDPAE
jgi:hypothetical protein